MMVFFNKCVDYIICIIGMESGVVKIFEGFVCELDEINVVWEGGIMELFFFCIEICLIEFIILEVDNFI